MAAPIKQTLRCRATLTTGGFLIILDGLDEIGSPITKQKANKLHSRMVVDFLTLLPMRRLREWGLGGEGSEVAETERENDELSACTSKTGKLVFVCVCLCICLSVD